MMTENAGMDLVEIKILKKSVEPVINGSTDFFNSFTHEAIKYKTIKNIPSLE